MGNVPVSKLKSGGQIVEDVLTPLGSVLFQKGKIINEREIEILKAFLVKSVPLTPSDNKQTDSEQEELQNAIADERNFSTFYQEYENMFILVKRIFKSPDSIPIMEIRERLQSLIENIQDYNILTFTPQKMNTEDYLYHNSIMVSLTSYSLAVWQGLTGKDLIPIAMAGLLHDIGNVKIDEAILRKPNTLTSEELKEVKQHTVYGYNLLKNVAGINDGVKLAALQHHEKEDGSGYPLGVKGEKIHSYAKIVSVADIFHAMTNKRHYKNAISPYLVLEQLLDESFGKLDPTLVQTFINKVTQFHNKTIVRLNDNSVGEIVFSDRAHPTRPWVNVKGKIINLTTERSLFIEEVIQD